MLHFVWLNSTLTYPYHPLFEIVYCLEACLLALFLVLAPLAAIGISRASPLHRNFRLVLLLTVLHMTIGAFSRISLMYNQIFVCDTTSASLTFSSVFRAVFFTFSMLLPLAVSIERFLATRWWEWYERQLLPTLTVFLACFIVIETGVFIPSFSVVFEVYSLPVQMTLFAFYLTVGMIAFFYLLNLNKSKENSLTARRITTRYSVAKHYQVKENLLVFAMLRKIAVPATVWAIPAFVLFSTYLAIPEGLFDFLKYFSVALFDLHISMYTLGLLQRMCTCDRKLIRGMYRIPLIGKRLGRKTQPEKTMSTQSKHEQDEGEFYFAQLAGDLAGPQPTN